MSAFGTTIKAALNDYKRILRSSLPLPQQQMVITDLGLKRRDLMYANDVDLYYKTDRVIRDLASRLDTGQRSGSWYSGLDEFYLFLMKLFSQYRLVNNRVVNDQQEASRALLNALQLLGGPHPPASEGKMATLYDSAKCVAQCGTKEHVSKFHEALLQFQYSHPNFYLTMRTFFEKQKKG